MLCKAPMQVRSVALSISIVYLPTDSVYYNFEFHTPTFSAQGLHLSLIFVAVKNP